MKNAEGRMVQYTILLFVGVAIYILGEIIGVIASFWGGMGIGIVVVSAIRLVQIVRFKNNAEYAKKLTVNNNDERNHFLATKARSAAFYYSILIEAVAIIIIYIIDIPEVAEVIGMVICGQLIIYYVYYFFLKSKY